MVPIEKWCFWIQLMCSWRVCIKFIEFQCGILYFIKSRWETTKRIIAKKIECCIFYRTFSIWPSLSRLDHLHIWKWALVDNKDYSKLLSGCILYPWTILSVNFQNYEQFWNLFRIFQNKKDRIMRIWQNNSIDVDLIGFVRYDQMLRMQFSRCPPW